MYLQYLLFVRPLLLPAAIAVWLIPDVADTFVCAPDDGRRYHPKHVEQFPDKINCVTLHLVGYILEILIMHGPMNVKFQILTSTTLTL